MTTGNPFEPTVDRLRADLRGRLVTTGDPDYDALRAIVQGGFDVRPAAIARVADATDVAAAITIARGAGMEIAVRSGGHSVAAHGTVEGGLVIDVRDLDGLDLDMEGRTAWVGGGLTAGAVTTALGAHGLAIGFGDTGSVGVAGITLGGGVGYLGRKHGLTIDSLLAVELVTADGVVHVVDAEREPDLFWAVRGGGGNFGVATRFRFRLQELPSVYGGMLILPATADSVAGFMAAAEDAPDDVSTIANVMPCPPMPFVAAEHHGALAIVAVIVAAADAERGERLVAPFRALATPLADLIKAMPYPEIYPPEGEDYHPMAVSTTMFMDRVGLDEARVILEHLGASDAAMRVAQLRPSGGAIARVPADATAYAHRARWVMVYLAAVYESDDERRAHQAWLDRFAAAIVQGEGGKYVNFVGDEGEAGVRAAYPGATWDRLAAIKRRYDPDNVFHRTQNVPPAPAP